MAAPPVRNFGSRGTTMAIACGAAMAGAIGSMYFIGRDVKGKEGASSLYTNEGKGINGSDKTMTSSEVASAVSVPKPSKDRLPKDIPRTQQAQQ